MLKNARPKALCRKDTEWYVPGKPFSNEYLLLKAIMRKEGPPRFGIIVKRKIGPAVTRNLIKRRLRNIFHHICQHNSAFSQGSAAYLLIVKKREVATACFKDLYSDSQNLIEGAFAKIFKDTQPKRASR